MKSKPIIFLDHDGVMCLYDESGGRFKKWKDNPEMSKMVTNGRFRINVKDIKKIPIEIRYDNFNKKAVNVLNKIIEATDAEIVVTSDWRHHATLEEMQQLYTQYGVIKQPIDFIPFARDLDGSLELVRAPDRYRLEIVRCTEINDWLSRHEHDKWVAIDDLDLSAETWMSGWGFGLEYFVHTPRILEGIKQTGKLEKAIKILKG